VSLVGPAFAQQSTSSEVKAFEVVSVDGNKVVVREAQGAKEYTVPEAFHFDVDGRTGVGARAEAGHEGNGERWLS
jgi:hypothetical protein